MLEKLIFVRVFALPKISRMNDRVIEILSPPERGEQTDVVGEHDLDTRRATFAKDVPRRSDALAVCRKPLDLDIRTGTLCYGKIIHERKLRLRRERSAYRIVERRGML
jgi:hypothetical protein